MSHESRVSRLERIADAAIDPDAANGKRLDIIDALILMEISVPAPGWEDLSPDEADAFVDRLWHDEYADGFRSPFPHEDAEEGREPVPVIDDGSVPGRIERIQRVFRESFLPPVGG